jgi:MFS family permease
LLLLGRTVNILGNTVAPIALAFAVLDLTGSASDLGLVVGSRTIVSVVFMLFGGVLADRLPRNLLMVGASLLAAATQGTIAVLVLTHHATIPWLIGLSALNGMVVALSMPASSAILTQLVRPEERQQANALNRLFFNAAAVVGAPVGGLIVAGVGPGWGIAADASTFLLAAVAFVLLRVPPPAPAGPGFSVPSVGPGAGDSTAGEGRKSIIADLATGWGEFRTREWLWVVVAGFSVINACWAGALSVLGPTVADAGFGRRAWGFILAAQTVGMILGAIVALRLRLRRYLFFGTAAVGVMVLPVAVLGLAPRVLLLLPAAFVAGVGMELFNVAWETTMQEHIPADKLARVYSYDMLGSLIAMPIGEIAAGPVAAATGTPEAALVGAAAVIALACAGMVLSPGVRNLPHELPGREKAPMEELPA